MPDTAITPDNAEQKPASGSAHARLDARNLPPLRPAIAAALRKHAEDAQADIRRGLAAICSGEREAEPEACGTESSCATVTLSICEASIDRWWSSLDLDTKADIFSQRFDCCAIPPGGIR